MGRSVATRLALTFPPIRRLHEAVRSLQSDVDAIAADQRGLRQDYSEFRSRNENVVNGGEPAVNPEPQGREPVRESEQTVEQRVAWELQSSALRSLPLLLSDFVVSDDGIEMYAAAAAADGLTRNMRFFLNGRAFDEVEYPIVDPALKARFCEIPWGGTTVHAWMRSNLDALRASRVFRLDASPTGVFVAGNWRQANHLMNPACEQYPMPPEPQIRRVIGDTSVTRFAYGGMTIFKNLEFYLAELGRPLASFQRILDWGCGAGRLTRYLLSETGAAVHGADIDADNIAWCNAALATGRGRFDLVPLMPPTAYPDGHFDLLVGLSVMTHLGEGVQTAWLAELRRIARPDALVFLSISGVTQFGYNGFSPANYLAIEQSGFLDLMRDPALDDVIADRTYYRSAFHSRAYVVERWGQFFEVVAFVDAIAAMQDFVVLRRRA